MRVRMELRENSDFLTVHSSVKIHTDRYSHEWLQTAEGQQFDGVIRMADGVNGVFIVRAHEVTVERSSVFSDKQVFYSVVKALHVYLVNASLVPPNELVEVMDSTVRHAAMEVTADSDYTGLQIKCQDKY